MITVKTLVNPTVMTLFGKGKDIIDDIQLMIT